MAEEMGAVLRAAACCSPEAITMGSQSLVPLQVQCQGGSGGPGGAEPSFPRGGGMPNPQQPQTLHLPNCRHYPRACSHCKADPIYKHPKISGCSCDLGLGEGGTPGSLLLPGQGSRILCHCHSNPLTGQKNPCSLPRQPAWCTKGRGAGLMEAVGRGDGTWMHGNSSSKTAAPDPSRDQAELEGSRGHDHPACGR